MNAQVLFLGYDQKRTRLIDVIAQRGVRVEWSDQKVDDLSAYDLVVSFGYRHILKAETLKTAKRPVLNLHIAYLPWNRGAHPLFWAAYDGTPIGVTIHEIDPGVDTGPICVQKRIELDLKSETFASAYRILFETIEALFETHADELLSGKYISCPQNGGGSFKRIQDLPSGFAWSDLIAPTIHRLKQATNAVAD